MKQRRNSGAFPVNLPVLFFIQKNHPATDKWIPEHEKLIKDSAHGEVVLLEANHYLYRSMPKKLLKTSWDL